MTECERLCGDSDKTNINRAEKHNTDVIVHLGSFLRPGCSFISIALNLMDIGIMFFYDETHKITSGLSLCFSQTQIDEQKERLKAINARPIKKVAEAKARKKRKVSIFLSDVLTLKILSNNINKFLRPRVF